MDSPYRPLLHALRGRSIVFHGMKRSGNHAVLRWILSGDRFDFRDNILPYETLHAQGTVDAHTHALPYPALGRLTFYNWVWKRRRMISVEDLSITHWLFDEPAPRDVHNVLLVRSASNMFASRIKKGFKLDRPALSRTMDATMLRTRRLWIEHAREALGETSFLDGKGKVVIVYDRFIVDPAYRRAIAAQLAITPDDSSLDRQAPEGHGSSFHADSAPQSAADLQNRAQFLNPQEHALLEAVLDEPELQRLNAKLLDFGPR